MKNDKVNLVNDIFVYSKSKGITHLSTEDQYYNGKTITINGKKLLNFGLCSYFGLEVDQRLKDAAIDAINNYGIHYACSRTYVSCTLYEELETLISKLFDAHVVLSTSLSLGHHSVMPIVIEKGDAIILDQQVHASVQDAAMKMQSLGVPVTIIRHSDLDELKKRTIELSSSYSKVWYLIDGVYSMYGDFAPINELFDLMILHKNLNLYIDDAHGMGWIGKNGRGYILSQVELNSRIILATSLNKAFGAGGGVFVFKDKTLAQKVKDCGNSFVFSAPHSLPVLGAAIASAKIFLSPDISHMQEQLAEKISYCHSLLKTNNLPVVSNPKGPIFFIGVGLTRVGYNLVNRILTSGFYINISMWPAVPETCTGIRFTITNHHSFEDIEKLVEAIAYHFPKALAEEERTIQDIHRAFRKVINFNEDKTPVIALPAKSYRLQHEISINEFDRNVWNNMFSERGTFDWNGLSLLEKTFKDNPDPEHNWDFHYYVIWDDSNKPVLATFFTASIVKDDIFSSVKVSRKLEIERLSNPYYLTSRAFMMGSLFTEGDHLYIERARADWKDLLMMLLDAVWKDQDKENCTILNLRDMDKNDPELCAFFKDQGFIMLNLPETHIVRGVENPLSEYMLQLTHDKRYYIKKRAMNFEPYFDVRVVDSPNEDELHSYYRLYKNVTNKNFEINIFDYPFRLFQHIASDPDWEFIELKLKPEFDGGSERLPVGVAINNKSNNNYCFLLTGMDYNYLESHQLYSQILWQIVLRANKLKAKQLFLGFTASQNKRKMGAVAETKVGFLQMKDSFNMAMIDMLESSEVANSTESSRRESIL